MSPPKSTNIIQPWLQSLLGSVVCSHLAIEYQVYSLQTATMFNGGDGTEQAWGNVQSDTHVRFLSAYM